MMAVNGITMERKTIISRMKLSPSTKANTMGWYRAAMSLKSMSSADAQPTYTVA